MPLGIMSLNNANTVLGAIKEQLERYRQMATHTASTAVYRALMSLISQVPFSNLDFKFF